MARTCRVTDQTMSRTVDHLVRGGFATRAVDPDDERRMRVTITAAGATAYRRVLDLERDGLPGADEDAVPPVPVSDPETLRSLLIEIVRAHHDTSPHATGSTQSGDRPSPETD